MATEIGRFEIGQTERLDELCPDCLTPALWKFDFVWLTTEGVGTGGHGRYCDRCEDHR